MASSLAGEKLYNRTNVYSEYGAVCDDREKSTPSDFEISVDCTREASSADILYHCPGQYVWAALRDITEILQLIDKEDKRNNETEKVGHVDHEKNWKLWRKLEIRLELVHDVVTSFVSTKDWHVTLQNLRYLQEVFRTGSFTLSSKDDKDFPEEVPASSVSTAKKRLNFLDSSESNHSSESQSLVDNTCRPQQQPQPSLMFLADLALGETPSSPKSQTTLSSPIASVYPSALEALSSSQENMTQPSPIASESLSKSKKKVLLKESISPSPPESSPKTETQPSVSPSAPESSAKTNTRLLPDASVATSGPELSPSDSLSAPESSASPRKGKNCVGGGSKKTGGKGKKSKTEKLPRKRRRGLFLPVRHRSSTSFESFGKGNRKANKEKITSTNSDDKINENHKFLLVNQIVKQFLCKRCNQIFSRSDSYQRHIRSAHLKVVKKYVCVICGVSSPRVDNVKKHLKMIHDLENGKVNLKDFIIEAPLNSEEAEEEENGKQRC